MPAPLQLPETIETETDIRSFFEYLLEVEKVSFHPDTPFSDYVNSESGRSTYSAEEIETRDRLMDECFNVVGDKVYDLSVEALTKYNEVEP